MIFLTGATGTVGSETVKALKAKGVALRIGSRNPAKAKTDLGVEAVAWDWDRPQDFPAALHGATAFFLLTPPGSDKELAYSQAALLAAKAAGATKVVKLSAIGVENNPGSAHRQVELAIEAAGFHWVHLRPSFFMQNFNEGMLADVKSGVLDRPTGDGKTGFIDARDIGAVAAETLTRADWDGQGLTLTGSEALSYGEVGAILSKALGRAIRHDDVTPEVFKSHALAAGTPEAYAEFMTQLYGFVKAGYTATVTPTVQQVLGRAPIQLAQYAEDYKTQLNG